MVIQAVKITKRPKQQSYKVDFSVLLYKYTVVPYLGIAQSFLSSLYTANICFENMLFGIDLKLFVYLKKKQILYLSECPLVCF